MAQKGTGKAAGGIACAEQPLETGRRERLVVVQSIEHGAQLVPLDIPARLNELRKLEDGWLDGEGLAPNDDALSRLAASFDRYYPRGLPLPHVYPTIEGGVQAEWSIQSNEVSLNVNLSTLEGEWHSLDMDTDNEERRMLNLVDTGCWAWLAERIRSLADIRG